MPTEDNDTPKNYNLDINYPAMESVCLATIEQFDALGTVTRNSAGMKHIFIDRGASVLAVAHLDSVQSTHHFYPITIGQGHYVLNAQLDDRLGAYIILNLLYPYANYDILLTEGEEVGLSTAEDFRTTKKYNWMFSFDRRGSDVVTYQYESNLLRKHLTKAGFSNIGHGSVSDICYLDHLHCEGFNVGCGYKDEHTIWAMADLDATIAQAERFLRFFEKFQNTRYPYTPAPLKTYEVTVWENGKPHTETRQYSQGRSHYRSHYAGGYDDYWGDKQWYQGTAGNGYNMHGQSVHVPVYLPEDGEQDESICSQCGHTITYKEAKKCRYPGVCRKCQDQMVECPLCSAAGLLKNMHGKDNICLQCWDRLIEGYSFFTKVRCNCGARLMTFELRERQCNSCHKKLGKNIPVLQFPDTSPF